MGKYQLSFLTISTFLVIQFLQTTHSYPWKTDTSGTGISEYERYKTVPKNRLLNHKLRSGVNEAVKKIDLQEETRFAGKPFVKQTRASKIIKKPVIYHNKGYMSNDIDAVLDEPPPHAEVAKMARYIVAHSDWAGVATISTRDPTIGSPYASTISVSDGTSGNGTGIPYLFLTAFDEIVMDIEKDSRASLAMSLAQSDYCVQQKYDPEDPRCAHVILTGRVMKIVPGSEEEKTAEKAMFSKHSAMEHWPKDHNWFFAKLEISNIMVRDYIGGTDTIPLDDYFKSG